MLFQLHIPKTGGTSLFAALAAAFPPGRSHVAMSEQELRDRTTGFDLLGGHFDWDTLAMFPEKPRVLTVLRDPVEMAMSAYGFWKSHPAFANINDPAVEEATSHSFDKLLLDPNSGVYKILGNTTNFLAGRNEVVGTRGRLEAAMRHLESCAWVGTTETLDRDMRVLPAMLGLPPLGESARLMVTPERPRRTDFGKNVLRIIEGLTENERILHDRALAIAEEQQRRYA